MIVALFDGTLGTGDDDIFAVRPPSHILRGLIEETPVVPESDELVDGSAEETGNFEVESADNPFLKVEISTITPEAAGVEPSELDDLQSDQADVTADMTVP